MVADTPSGAIADTLRGVDGVEIKGTIPEHQIDAALSLYGLKPADEDERFIYFFDTPQLDLFSAGVICRARRVVGGEHDSTIKFRPVRPEAVPGVWSGMKGFKIEADASERHAVVSASLTMKVERGLIKRVAAGDALIADLFVEQQVKFLLALSQRTFDYSRVMVLGPVQSWKWKLKDPGLPWDVTVELWKRADGERLLEASIKVPVTQAAVGIAGLSAYFRDRGAAPDDCQQAKTHWALAYHARQAAESPPAPATNPPAP